MIRRQQQIAALVVMPAGSDAGFAPFADTTVLGHTIRRLSRCSGLDRIVVLHEAGQKPEIPNAAEAGPAVVLHEGSALFDASHEAVRSARKWAATSWRGGLAGATCYDELLTAKVMAEAIGAAGAEAGLIVGADWPLVDPALCEAVIARHLEAPEHHRLVFTQAPPGLAGCLITQGLLRELVEHGATIGMMLDYQPASPQPDPIGRDACVAIDHRVRNATMRVVFDHRRWRRPLTWLARHATPAQLLEWDAWRVVDRLQQTPQPLRPESTPSHYTVELNTQRAAAGPIVPQHHAALDRPQLTLDAAHRLFEQMTANGDGDVTVTLGGLGDALLHPRWAEFITAARRAGVAGVHIETDLLVENDALSPLLELPIDVVSVRINADTEQTYQRLMGVDGFDHVMRNMQWLLDHRRERTGRRGLPWIVPRMVKTAENVHELEPFFDRWMHFCGHAWIEAPSSGCGLMTDASVLDMSPPRRVACRQLHRRMTIHSDGRAALCDQDWRGDATIIGEATTLADAWRAISDVRLVHAAGDYEPTAMCGSCRQWHRP